jgi:hypothetical protein
VLCSSILHLHINRGYGQPRSLHHCSDLAEVEDYHGGRDGRSDRPPPFVGKERGPLHRHGHGEVIEEGTHNALLTQEGSYAELYSTYFRQQSLEYINEATWKVTLVPEELGEVAAD